MTVVPHPPYFSVSPIEDNSERPLLAQLRWSTQNRRRWWTPSQNTISRMHLRNCRSAWEQYILAKEDYFVGDGGH
jgi:hypothetical protein